MAKAMIVFEDAPDGIGTIDLQMEPMPATRETATHSQVLASSVYQMVLHILAAHGGEIDPDALQFQVVRGAS